MKFSKTSKEFLWKPRKHLEHRSNKPKEGSCLDHFHKTIYFRLQTVKHHSLPVTLFSTYEIRFVWTWICHIDWKCLFRGCRIISEQPPFSMWHWRQQTGIFSDFQQTSFTTTQSHVECTRFMTVSFDSEKAQALILLFSSVTTFRL